VFDPDLSGELFYHPAMKSKLRFYLSVRVSFDSRMLVKRVFYNFVLIITGLRDGRAFLVQIHFYDIEEKKLLTIPFELLKI